MGYLKTTMDRATYSVRPAGEPDFEAVARINTALQPEIPDTAEDIRHWDDIQSKAPGRFRLKLAVEENRSGSVVAWGELGHTWSNFHPDKYRVFVAVHPEQKHRGIGRELYRLLERAATERNAICLWSSSREDVPRDVHFLERAGFIPRRKMWQSRLDLTNFDPSRFPDRSKALAEQGIRITTLTSEGADRPQVRQRLYQLGRVTSEDAPRMGEYTPITFEEFVVMNVTGPMAIPAAVFLACRGEEYIGWSTLERVLGTPDTVAIGFTGTLPEFRNRGIASELKRWAVEYARTHGFRSLITGNDSLNQHIWAINERLGFRPETTWIQGEKVLPAAGSK